jgi:putative tricarboxylic transport membrane protein
MADTSPQRVRSTGPTQRSVEIGVAVSMAIFALIVIAGSVQAGIGWGSEGPKAGFFPFYIGLTILGSSIINFATVFAERPDRQLFAEWGQLRKVLSMLVPTTIYVASALLIAVFMRWLGGYGWRMLVAIALGVPVATFVIFEKWFLVPLPKGPIEALLGF